MSRKTQKQNVVVNAQNLNLKDCYVCWIDIMGTKTIMSEKFQKAANFIIRFHSCCATLEQVSQLRCYPLMDGVFLVSEDLPSIQNAVKTLYGRLSDIFINENHLAYRFVIRGSIAYGEISHGEDISSSVCKDIATYPDYKKYLLFGLPMIQAFKSEKKAPPFGIYIHESARQVEGLQGRYYVWYNDDNTQLKDSIIDYFEWCRMFSNYLEFDQAKIDYYMKLTNEYFLNQNITFTELRENIKERRLQ